MKVLAIDSASPELSVSLADGGMLLASWHEAAPQRGIEALAPLVSKALQSRGWEAASLGLVAVSQGPGSFTGLRASLAFAQGLLLGTPVRLIAVATSLAWAQAAWPNAPEGAEVLVALDARRGLVYRALWRRESRGWALALPEAMLSEARFWEEAAAWPEAKLALGAGVAVPRGPWVVAELSGQGRSAEVAELAWQALQADPQAGLNKDIDAAYLRPSEAELLWQRLHPKGA